MSDLVALIRQLIAQALLERQEAVEGFVSGYDPDSATIHATVGTTGTLDDDEDPDAQTLRHQPVPLLLSSLNAQGGPLGVDRVVLIPYEGGPAALHIAGPDDALGVPAGEYHIFLRDAILGTVRDAFLKVQSDATRIGHTKKISALAPVIIFGADDPNDAVAVIRLTDLQNALDGQRQATQNAINQLAASVQAGSGVAPPTIAQTQAQGSKTTFST